MSDEDAFQVVVRDHDGEYCTKAAWREHRATPYRVEREDNCLAKLVGNKISATPTLARHDQHKRASR